MKVIDLLNKIENGEEVPKKIKFENVIYEYDEEHKDYIHEITNWHSETLLFKVMNCHYIKEILETRVELIEDEIEEIKNEVMNDDWRYYIPIFFNKINEIVRSNNKLNREIKELKER